MRATSLFSKFFLVSAFIFLFNVNAFANLPYYPLTFPRDEAAHYKNVPYQYGILVEWWYFNGSLTTEDGKHLSYDVALFNAATRNKTMPLLQIQIADLDKKQVYGSAKLYPLNTGTLSTESLNLSINKDYNLLKTKLMDKEVYILQASGQDDKTDMKIDLILEPKSQPFLINQTGLLQMSRDTNAYYYSIPLFETSGTIKINEKVYQIKNKEGQSWHDHQWGDFKPHKYGWEWFGIRLNNGLIANIILSYEFQTQKVIDGLANIILPNGEKRYIPYKDFIVNRSDYWYDEKLQINYPMTYTFNFPTLGLQLSSTAAFPEQELHGYWEGYCKVNAVYNKQDIQGYSYTELVLKNPLQNLFLHANMLQDPVISNDLLGMLILNWS